MSNRAPGIIWTLRREWGAHQAYVHTAERDMITLGLPDPNDDTMSYVFDLTRKDARLLAKRINECLDYTVKGKK